jgi:hypothetical protein
VYHVLQKYIAETISLTGHISALFDLNCRFLQFALQWRLIAEMFNPNCMNLFS